MDDITAEFEFLFPQDKKKPVPLPHADVTAKLEDHERILYEAMVEPMSLDQLTETTSLSIEKVTTAALMLELKGLVRCLPGKVYDRK